MSHFVLHLQRYNRRKMKKIILKKVISDPIFQPHFSTRFFDPIFRPDFSTRFSARFFDPIFRPPFKSHFSTFFSTRFSTRFFDPIFRSPFRLFSIPFFDFFFLLDFSTRFFHPIFNPIFRPDFSTQSEYQNVAKLFRSRFCRLFRADVWYLRWLRCF